MWVWSLVLRGVEWGCSRRKFEVVVRGGGDWAGVARSSVT